MSASSLTAQVIERPLSWFTRSYVVTGLLPSTIPVLVGFVLLRSGAWSGQPHWDRGLHALAFTDVRTAVCLAGMSLALSIVSHPLQAGLNRLAQGQWGTSELAAAVQRRLTVEHVRRFRRFEHRRQQALKELPTGERLPEYWDDEQKLAHVLEYDRFTRLKTVYPTAKDQITATMVGNSLGRYDVDAGLAYNLDLMVVAPLLRLISPKDHVEYIDDRRQQFELAVRLLAVAVVTSLLMTVWLWRAGAWMLLALVPYALAVALYGGAVAAADEFGAALEAVLHLNRHTLYRRLGLAPVHNPKQERRQNSWLRVLLRKDMPLEYRLGKTPIPLTYRAEPADQAADDGPS